MGKYPDSPDGIVGLWRGGVPRIEYSAVADGGRRKTNVGAPSLRYVNNLLDNAMKLRAGDDGLTAFL